MASAKTAKVVDFLLQLVFLSAGLLTSIYFTKKFMEKDKKKSSAKAIQELLRHLGREDRKVSFSSHELIVANGVISPNDVTVTFADIGGLDKVRNSIEEMIVLPISRPELFQSRLLGVPKGVLLYGPPGTGKTMLAKAIAKEAGAVFVNVSMSTIQDMYYGESQKLVRAIFDLAWKLEPCVIFIDEIDSFLNLRGQSSEHQVDNQMKAEFMALWDGLLTPGQREPRVIVLGASNQPWAIDDAILRRLTRKFYVAAPDAYDRKWILKKILKGERLDRTVDLNALAKATEGFTGSDLKELCKATAAVPVLEFVREEERRKKKSPEEQKQEDEFLSKLTPYSAADLKPASTGKKKKSRLPALENWLGGKKETKKETRSPPPGPLREPRELSQKDFMDTLESGVVRPSFDRFKPMFEEFAKKL